MLSDQLDQFVDDVISFINDHSQLKYMDFESTGFFSISGDYAFEDLDQDGLALQHKLMRSAQKLWKAYEISVSEASDSIQNESADQSDFVMQMLVQDSITHLSSTKKIVEALEKARTSLKKILQIVLPSSEDPPVLVPDTNALYFKTDLETWEIDGFSTFELVLTPSVLSDLDRHKIEHRVPEVRDKAKTWITKIKEYRRRGRLSEGVAVVRGKIQLRTIAAEPNFANLYSSLDPNNDDDRLIAETLELTLAEGGRIIALLTGDINLQNKCELYKIPFLDSKEIK